MHCNWAANGDIHKNLAKTEHSANSLLLFNPSSLHAHPPTFQDTFARVSHGLECFCGDAGCLQTCCWARTAARLTLRALNRRRTLLGNKYRALIVFLRRQIDGAIKQAFPKTQRGKALLAQQWARDTTDKCLLLHQALRTKRPSEVDSASLSASADSAR